MAFSAPRLTLVMAGVALLVSTFISGCSDTDGASNLPAWGDDPCATVPEVREYEEVMGRWGAQTDLAPFEGGRTVFTGSSSIRFWEGLQEDLGAWAPIQRGFGGSILWDLAEYLPEAVLRHEPSAVVLFSGTNDIARDLAPREVADAYRCVVERIADGLGDDVSIHYIAITPTPARWEIWPNAAEANRLIEEIAADWRGLYFIDTTPVFLATGEPPDASLFISDGLHLTDAGYELWREVVGRHLGQNVPRYEYSPTRLAAPMRVLIDLGPSNPEAGAPTSSPDGFGQHWNSWSPVASTVVSNAGEHLGNLVDTTGMATPVRLVFSTSNHFSAGIGDGGLLEPDAEKIGTLAVPTATQDYIFTAVTGTVIGSRGSLTFEGLDPSARYSLRFFASRTGTDFGVTRYTVTGADTRATAELTTSGAGIGEDGAYDGNDSEIAELRSLAPDAFGRLHIDFDPSEGTTAYLSLLELTGAVP